MWNEITFFLNFTGVKDKTVWQDVFFSSFLIPIMIFLGVKFLEWWNERKPAYLIFKDCLAKDSNIYIFHSQMSSADQNYNLIDSPKYITRYPNPIPTDHTNLEKQRKCNIDPVCSEADSKCVADIFNI
jgi:hypothetical protein